MAVAFLFRRWAKAKKKRIEPMSVTQRFEEACQAQVANERIIIASDLWYSYLGEQQAWLRYQSTPYLRQAGEPVGTWYMVPIYLLEDVISG